ncbi:recombinase family protein [Streptomyces sp. NPDC058217]|uniref:recombinase family protein n=1 Tax=Streptomyces sp. NPDC058217 TaxID=3346384 RepID=UPI0036E13EAB
MRPRQSATTVAFIVFCFFLPETNARRPPRPAGGLRVPEAATKPTRVGYARCSTAQQGLQSQLDALVDAGCDPVFSEKISTRIKVRPEFVKAMDFARTIKKAVPHHRVTLRCMR